MKNWKRFNSLIQSVKLLLFEEAENYLLLGFSADNYHRLALYMNSTVSKFPKNRKELVIDVTHMKPITQGVIYLLCFPSSMVLEFC